MSAPQHSLVRHALFAVLLLAGIGQRLASSYGLGAGQVAGLVSGIAVYLVVLRWGGWSWLAALAAAPALLDARLVADPGPAGSAALLLVTAALAVACWQAWARPAVPVLVVACLLVPAGLLARHAGAVGERIGVVALHPALPFFALGLLLGLAAAVGLGRSEPLALRVACALTALVPLALVVVTVSEPGGWQHSPAAVVWWPAAGALGVTALLRGRRGAAAHREQVDDVDRAATADFVARYGSTPLAPVTVVIAAYNEAEGLPGVLDLLPTEVCGLPADVLVVDDGSSDGTAAAILGTRARVVACPVNRGQGAALRLGYRLAREHGARYVITTDADGQYDVGDFPAVLTPILEDRADFVSGSRILGHQHTRDKVRRLGVHVFAWLATILTGRRLTDTSFGLRAMRAELTGVVTLNQPQYQSSELMLGAISHGFRVVEVPGTMHVRSAGSTKKGRNLVYGSRYARVMTGTWWREGCPVPVTETAAALRAPRSTSLRHTQDHVA